MLTTNILITLKYKEESLVKLLKKIVEDNNSNKEPKVYMNTWKNYNENGADLSQYGINSISDGWMTIDEAREFAEKNKCFFALCSAYEGVGIEEAFKELAKPFLKQKVDDNPNGFVIKGNEDEPEKKEKKCCK